MKKYILASASPRRRELLEQIGLDFDIFVSNADESKIAVDSMEINLYVEELALLKATDTAAALKEKGEKNHLIIAADTVVNCGGEILGKPKDEKDAYEMLKKLSASKHEVYTGFCVMRLSDGFSVADFECTEVFFKELNSKKILKYIDTKEPMDKAGAYGIQGLGALFIDRIDGDYFNVVGLPISKLAGLLEREFGEEIL